MKKAEQIIEFIKLKRGCGKLTMKEFVSEFPSFDWKANQFATKLESLGYMIVKRGAVDQWYMPL